MGKIKLPFIKKLKNKNAYGNQLMKKSGEDVRTIPTATIDSNKPFIVNLNH
jgi:hypothetical protein